MKDYNKILYDILLKIEISTEDKFRINKELVIRYFQDLEGTEDEKYRLFEDYFLNFYNFCFELSLNNMIRDAIKFKNSYGCT